MLLLGAGTGEATCGILYLASYLRRHGVEAYVRLNDADETEDELVRSLEALVAHVRPRLVGISLKWYHHVARARLIARTLRKLDPEVRIVLGGNTASHFWRELLAWDCVDDVVLGDGEVPLLSLCRGEPSPPNAVTRGAKRSPPWAYVQRASNCDEVYYSHFDEIFLSQLDLHCFSGWVAPGRGCTEDCLYCAGTRGVQQATFGRTKPFLRDAASVQRDHREIASRTWQLRYDFPGGTADFLESTWAGIDLSRHCATFFLWGALPRALADTLARTFQRVYLILDIGCFSEVQRQELRRRGLLKPCPSDAELLEIIGACRRHENLALEISGIAGLPFATARTLLEERRLVERVLGLGCTAGYQRLQAQPGALVTERPERFAMQSEARTFAELVDYFAEREPGDASVPMIRFRDRALEAAVQRTSEDIDEKISERAASAARVEVKGDTRLLNASAWTRELELGDWLGRYRVPPSAARERVTAVRSIDGAGLACAPSLDARRFSDPTLKQGRDGAALLAVLAAFEHPTSVKAALAKLRSKAELDAKPAREIVDHLVAARFLRQA